MDQFLPSIPQKEYQTLFLYICLTFSPIKNKLFPPIKLTNKTTPEELITKNVLLNFSPQFFKTTSGTNGN